MNYVRIKKLPTIPEIIQAYPLSAAAHEKIMQDREEIKNILSGVDQRLLIIIGPCSAWPKEAVLEYAKRLSALNPALQHALKIVLRLYIQKPRTTKGWCGPVNQPDPYAASDIAAGMHYAREMMVNVVNMGLPIADECLFTHNSRGFAELVAWFAIGARSSEDHEHRIFASAANCPVGMKNPTHGSLKIAVNSVVAAQCSHIAAIEGYEIQTFGNPYAHLVLRGANQAPNYSIAHLKEVQEYFVQHQIKNPAVIVDVSHDNCLMNGKKDYRAQVGNIFKIMQDLKKHTELHGLVKGFMVESFIKDGKQNLSDCRAETIDLGGLSITDPCLGWDETEKLLLELAKEVQTCARK